MSEQKSGHMGNFIKDNKKAELAVGVGVAAAAGAAFGVKKLLSKSSEDAEDHSIKQRFVHRRKRHHELHTFSGTDQTDRLAIFTIEDEEELTLNLATNLAGQVYSATVNGDKDGISTKLLLDGADKKRSQAINESLSQLVAASFVEPADVDGHQGYKATPDLVEAIMEGRSEALSQYFYYHA